MNYKMIALDLDGTLTNSRKEISPRTKEALMKAQEQGVKLVLASGRPVYGIMPLAKELCLKENDGYILAYNGGKIIECRTGTVIFQNALTKERSRMVIRAAECAQTDVLSYDDEWIVTNNRFSPYAQEESRINCLELKQVEDMEAWVHGLIPKFILLGHPDDLAKKEPLVKRWLGDEFSIYRSAGFFLEVMPKGIDKARSLGQLLLQLRMKPEALIACGDGYNDLSMIDYAGLGVVMANGVDVLKEHADFVTDSNDEDGIARVVERFIFS